MKIAVYAIALNEEQFVQTWFDSAKDADVLLIADTGSTDNTVALARSLGITVHQIGIRPWRFDDARNASLALLPLDVDYCIALDLDEVLSPNWRAELEKAHAAGWTRPRYSYTWNWNEDGTPGLVYGGDKIHTRTGYRWKHPVHEVCRRYDQTPETQGWVGLEIHHHADNTKPRSQYLPLLSMSVQEDPHDDRNAFYYARELFFYGRTDEAAVEFQRHLNLPSAVWAPERATSMRYLHKITGDVTWLHRAIEQAPGRREALVELAQHHHNQREWQACYDAALAALAITERPLEYLCENFAWGHTPHDLAALAAYHLGLPEQARAHGARALEFAPDDQRLRTNLDFYLAA